MQVFSKIISIISSNKLLFTLFVFSILSTYSYADFRSNMSVGTGHAYFAKSIVLSPNFNLNDYWGNAGEDTMFYEGNYYLPYAPLNAVIMAIPYFCLMVIYFIYTFILRGTLEGEFLTLLESLALSIPSTLAFIGILFLIKKFTIRKLGLTKFQSSFLIASIGLGTILFIYSVSFFNHIVAAFFILAAYYTLESKLNKKYRLAGILVGLAFLTEFPTVFFCIGVFIAELIQLFRKRITFRIFAKNLLEFAIPVAIAILLIFAYNTYLFDGPLNFGEHVFKEYRRANDKTTYGFTQNPMLGLYESLLSPLKGVFVYSPFLLLSLFGVRKYIKENQYTSPILISYLAIIPFLYAFWDDCYGASAYGNRYLTSILPFLGILLAYSMSAIYKHVLLKILFFCTVILSISLNTTNTLFGLADGKMGECFLFINNYDPYTRAIRNLAPDDGTIAISPIIIVYLKGDD